MVFTHSVLPACPQPLLVRSLQLVEVRPYAEEEGDLQYHQSIIMDKTPVAVYSIARRSAELHSHAKRTVHRDDNDAVRHCPDNNN